MTEQQADQPTTDTTAPGLVWEDAGTDEPGDENATSHVVEHGFWALGPAHPGQWSVELIVRDEDLREIEADGVHLGYFPSSAEAKAAAAEYEAAECEVQHAPQNVLPTPAPAIEQDESASRLAETEHAELYSALVRLCQSYGITTEGTYNHLHAAINSISTTGDDE